MLRIGYVRLRDQAPTTDTHVLKLAGCHVVRAEEPPHPGEDDCAVLESILEFISEGDQLVVTRLENLGRSGRRLLEILDRLEHRGASLFVVDSQLSTDGDAGRSLRVALEAIASMEPIPLARRRRAAAAGEILELQRAGVGPVEIARRLGVSRMTVWRKLKAVGA